MTIRLLAKTCLACGYSWSGAARWLARKDPTMMPFIAGYHRVVQDFDQAARHTIPSMLVSAATFEKHLDWLGRNYRFITLADIGLHLENDRPFPHPVAAITFDDGYADVYHNAFPILKRKGIPAAVFLVTGSIGTRQRLIHDRLYDCLVGKVPSPFSTMTTMLTRTPQSELLRKVEVMETVSSHNSDGLEAFLPMSWEMIEEMQRSDITFGSHTRSHALLTAERLSDLKQQLTDSRQTLETRLKRPIEHFAYPDGRFNGRVLEAVQQAGYRFAYTICPQRDARFLLFTIPRKVFWEKSCTSALGHFSSALMRCHTDGVFEARGGCEHIH